MSYVKTWMAICWITVLMSSQNWAGAESFSHPIDTRDKHNYVVSGILRKPSEGMVIKLAHSVERARSEEEAIGQFSRKATRQYPGYSVMETVVSPAPELSCGWSI